MLELRLVKLTDTRGGVRGVVDKVTYQALTEDELDKLFDMK